MLGEQRVYTYGLYIVVMAHLLAYNFNTVNLHNNSITISHKNKAKFEIKRAHYNFTNRTRTCSLVRSKATGKLKMSDPRFFDFDLDTRAPPIRKRPPDLSL